MTDDLNPDDTMSAPSDLDDLASAVLDGQATAAERARIDADPDLAARIQEFRELADQLADVESLPDDRRESLIGAALAAAVESVGQTDPALAARTHAPRDDLAPPRVVSLDRRRARRGPDTRVLVAVAAGIIAILAIPALLIGLNATSNVHDTAASSGDADASYESGRANSDSNAASETPTGAVDPDGMDEETSAYGTAALGTVDSPTELRTSVKAQLDSNVADGAPVTSTTGLVLPTTTTMPESPPTPATTFNPTCDDIVREQTRPQGPLVLSGSVDYQGIPRQVYTFQVDATGPVLVVVVESDTCAIVTQTTVTPD